MKKSLSAGLAVLLLATTAPSGPAAADEFDREALVARAAHVMKRFGNSRVMGLFRSTARKANGVLIIPRLMKGGFIFGGSGGSGVLLALDRSRGQWSAPAFYTIGSFTFGLQAGGEVSEIILLIMTPKGLDAFRGDSVKLGADISVAAGPIGLGAKGQTADVIAFSRTRGFYGGISLEGAVILSRDSWNHSFYRRRVTPSDIFMRGLVGNEKAESLRRAVAKVAGVRRASMPAAQESYPPTQRQPDPLQPVERRRYYPPTGGQPDLPPPSPRRDDSVTSEELPWLKK